MAKRKRRERDRPKAPPDAPYNPNKRVLLSYESDEEEGHQPDQLPSIAASPNIHHSPLVAHHLELGRQAPQSESNIRGADNDGIRVETTDIAGKQDLEDDEHRVGLKGNAGNKFKPDLATGQRPALGSLSYQGNEGFEDEGLNEADEDAMAYLRAVRSERQIMPSVFNEVPINTDGGLRKLYGSAAGDQRGFFRDGVYSVRPALGPQLPHGMKTTTEPEEAFAQALVTRFNGLHRALREPITAEALAALDERHPVTLPSRSNRAYAEWSRLVCRTSPSITQLQAMDKSTVLNILGLIQRVFIQRGKRIERGVSAWTFSLLARLDDVRDMPDDQVSFLRDLGKKAFVAQLSFSDPNTAAELEAMRHVEKYGTLNAAPEVENGVSSIDEAHFDRPAAEVAAEDEDKDMDNTLATLDSVLVIVGECFGQRDLLELRSWPPQT